MHTTSVSLPEKVAEHWQKHPHFPFGKLSPIYSTPYHHNRDWNMDPLLGQRTHFPKRGELGHNWVLVDAKDQILGRVSSRIASLLLGKHKRNFQPGQLVGDHVVVINASQVKLSGNKAQKKEYLWHSRYYGGMKKRPYLRQLEMHPEKIIYLAVKGMLPKNKFGRKLLTRLRVFAGSEHNLHAQKPRTIN